MIKLLYFAALPDRLGTSAEEVDLPEGVATVRALLALLRARGGEWEHVFGAGALRVTVNKRFADPDTPIKAGDEVAFVSAVI